MSKFEIIDTPLKGLKVIRKTIISDDRGYLSRFFCAEELKDAGWKKNVAQINHTLTNRKGTIRGMHYQNEPYKEMKLVTCLQGAIYDVAVDIRIDSPTFLHHFSIELDRNINQALLIPEGFAHGFQALTDKIELLYLHSNFYSPSYENGLNPLDKKLNIDWPNKNFFISSTDKNRKLIDSKFKGI